MKVKTIYTWEEKDLGNGRWITRQSSSPNSNNISFMCSVTYKLGFMITPRGNKYYKISVCDGMVIAYDSKEALINALNEDREGYRPTLPIEYSRMSEYLNLQCTSARP